MKTLGNSEACDSYLNGLPIRRCTGVSFEFQTSSYKEQEGKDSWRQHQASKKCCACGNRITVDVSPNVPRSYTTAEAWAGYWSLLSAKGFV